ncbi:MAG TPA: glutathione S-transferase [Polyangiales bacterium]|jgi:glutathione S-transferase|nr:glutathione S-transferase [Polyangiales bacterium]
MIVVHHLNNSRSQRVLWLLEELGVPYEIKHYQRDAKTMLAPPSLRAVHPLGKSPVITDNGLTIAESGAILEYLVDTYGQDRFRPAAGTQESMQYRYFMHYAEGSLMPLLLIGLVFLRMPLAPMPFFVKPIVREIAKRGRSSFVAPQVEMHLAFLERTLEQSEWFAGSQLTAADIQMSFPVEAAVVRGGLDAKYPKLVAFRDRIHARPAYQRALERGGPFDLMS